MIVRVGADPHILILSSHWSGMYCSS